MNRLFTYFFETMSKSGQFFYAVKRGRVPGVYLSWHECEKQIKGFPNPVFKKFPSKEDCYKFIGGENASSAFSKSSDFNSLANLCSKTPEKSSQSSSDTESTRQSLAYSVQLLNKNMKYVLESIETLKTGLIEVRTTLSRLENSFFTAPGSKRSYSTLDLSHESPCKVAKVENKMSDYTGSKFSDSEGVEVYTDGGCFSNGRSDARAGIGVYWAPNDPDNISEPLQGKPTNNRAEIYAALRAIQIAKKKGIPNLILHTDSQFLINGITKWIKGWKKKQWINSTGNPVINKDDFEALDEELKGINVKWVYVRGHNGNTSNEAADRLAKSGAEKYGLQC
ncbi:ribonuclease H1 [Biomphalaria pfeifferi]|uniref:Ribonuclease H1 n=1 Tax=Biomphalaria pfeifferi TaxID=112525 RepID=A0AAD8AZZ7_BIOPF|nr:ribonuclease H1 [Biomphalaria pfeifferi]